MTYQSSEGIILHATPFRDFDTVFTVFTPSGKLSLIKKGGRNQISPLTHVEATYYIGKGGLYTCSHLATLNHHLSLRRNLPTLEAACEMVKAVRALLFPEQEYKNIFEKLLKCFQLLPHASDPSSIVSWFYLHLLEHEGLRPPSLPLPEHPGLPAQENIKLIFYKLIQ